MHQIWNFVHPGPKKTGLAVRASNTHLYCSTLIDLLISPKLALTRLQPLCTTTPIKLVSNGRSVSKRNIFILQEDQIGQSNGDDPMLPKYWHSIRVGPEILLVVMGASCWAPGANKTIQTAWKK